VVARSTSPNPTSTACGPGRGGLACCLVPNCRSHASPEHLDGTVIVAVVAVGVVQVPVDEVVDMVAVWHRLMPTTGAVLVAGLVAVAMMVGSAAIGILRTEFQDMLLDEHGTGWMVNVTVVKVIDMPLVLDRGVAAACSVLVASIGMDGRRAHKPMVSLINLRLNLTFD
jgi:hypothetical protein